MKPIRIEEDRNEVWFYFDHNITEDEAARWLNKPAYAYATDTATPGHCTVSIPNPYIHTKEKHNGKCNAWR